ncbi:MAG: outer membrane beta-barrel protein [Pseudomonadota bacterium]|jgi:opacity protein-like surface antigen
MKILRAAVAATSLLGAAFCSSNAIAEHHEMTDRLYIKPEIAYVLPADGDVDDTVFLGARVGYELDDNWAAELESGWMEYGWDASATQKNLDITTIPVLANLRYGQRCSDAEMGWYGYGGIGWAFNDLEDNSEEMRADGSFAWQIGAGVEYPITTGLDVFLDIRYLWNRSNIDIPNGRVRTAADDAVLSSVLFTTGVKF